MTVPRSAVMAALAAGMLLTACRRQPSVSEGLPAPIPPCAVDGTTVRADRVEADGVIAFIITAERCPLSRAIASQTTLDRLLFIGVPQSTQTLPMLDRPELYREQPPTELRRLKESGWSDFIVAAESRSNGEYFIRVDVGGLRRWLERNRLARKFGYP